MTEREEILFNLRQAVNDGEITPADAAYVRAQVELECQAEKAWKGMEQK